MDNYDNYRYLGLYDNYREDDEMCNDWTLEND